jgi:plasmid maintenance system antidote protein VapI
MNLQSAYDLRKVEQQSKSQIRREIGPLKKVA